MDDVIVYKRIDESTTAEQVELFNSVFNSSKTVEEWRYKHYHANANTEVYGALLGEKLVGIVSFSVCAYNINGEKINFVQMCDGAVSKEVRRRGVFSNIYKCAYDTSYNVNIGAFIAIFLGFPLGKTYEAFHKLGWFDTVGHKSIAFIANPLGCLAAKAGIARNAKSRNSTAAFSKFFRRNTLRSKKNISTITVSQEYPFSDKEIDSINNLRPISVTYTKDLLVWKVDNNKKAVHKYYVARYKNELVAFFITAEPKQYDPSVINKTAIIDWAFFPDKIGEKELLNTASALIEKIAENTDVITVWKSSNNQYKKLFSKLGFIDQHKKESPYVVKGESGSKDFEEFIRNLDNWDPRFIEIDVIL